MSEGTLEWFTERYDAALKRSELPKTSDTKNIAAFNEERAAFLAGMAEDLLELVSERANHQRPELEKIVDAAVNIITRKTDDISCNLLQAQYFTDTEYAALTHATTDDGTPSHTPLDAIASDFTRIYSALTALPRHVKTHTGTKKKYTSAGMRIEKLAEQFKDIDGIKEDKQALGRFIVNTVMGTRAEYVRTRTEIEDAVRAYEEKKDALIDGTEEKQLTLLSAGNLVKTDAQLENLLNENEKRMPEAEWKSYRARFIETRTHLTHSLPAYKEFALLEANARITDALQHTNELLTYNDQGVVDHENVVLEALRFAQGIVRELCTERYFKFVNEKPDERHAILARNVNALENQFQFFKKGKGSFLAMIDAVRKPGMLLEPRTLANIANEYDTVYAQHAWKSKTKTEGAYAFAENLRKDLIDTVAASLREKREEIDSAMHAFVVDGSGAERISSITQSWTNIREIVEKGSKSEKAEGFLYKSIAALSEYKDLNASMKEPQKFIRSIREMRYGVNVDLREVPDEKIFSTYLAQRDELARNIGALPPEIRESGMVRKTVDDISRRLEQNLDARVQKVLEMPRRSLTTMHHITLERHKDRLADLMRAAADAGITKAHDAFRAQYDEHMSEIGLRKNGFVRLMRGITARLRGYAPENVYDPDTNVFMSAPDALAYFGPENGAVLNATVWRELEHLKEHRDPETAREAHLAMEGILKTLGLEPGATNATLHTEYLGKGISIFTDTPAHAGPIYWYNRHARLERFAAKRGALGMFARAGLAMIEKFNETANNDMRILQDAQLFRQAAKAPFGSAPSVVIVTRDKGFSVNAIDVGGNIEKYKRGSTFIRPEELYPGYRYITLPDTLWSDILAEKVLTERHLESILGEAERGSNLRSDPEGNMFHRVDPAFFHHNEFVIVRHPSDPLLSLILKYEDGNLKPLTFIPEEARRSPMLHFESTTDKPIIKYSPNDERQACALELLYDKRMLVVSIAGGNGSGKTLMAAAAGIKTVRDPTYPYEKIDLTVPKVRNRKSDEGYLPGDAWEKQIPRARGFLDNASKLLGIPYDPSRTLKGMVHEIIARGVPIEPNALTTIRGQNIENAYRIGDEWQNSSKEEMEAWAGRSADGTKTVIIGDPWQYDGEAIHLKFTNGLLYARSNLGKYPWYGHISLGKVERSDLARAIHEIRERRGL